MTIEHSLIPDADLHEPKGAAGAVAGTSYISDGLGSGNWERSLRSDHADMLITNNAVATAVPLAVDSTLNTDTDYVKIATGWAVGHQSGITFNTDSLLVSVTGDYFISFWASILIPLNNNFIGVKYAINDTTPYSLQKIVSQSATTSDYRNVSGSAVVSLTAGDFVSMYIAASKADNLVVEEAGMIMHLVHTA